VANGPNIFQKLLVYYYELSVCRPEGRELINGCFECTMDGIAVGTRPQTKNYAAAFIQRPLIPLHSRSPLDDIEIQFGISCLRALFDFANNETAFMQTVMNCAALTRIAFMLATDSMVRMQRSVGRLCLCVCEQ